jgi:hypothetical protein
MIDDNHDNDNGVNDKFAIFWFSDTNACWAVEQLLIIDQLLQSVKASFYFVIKSLASLSL